MQVRTEEIVVKERVRRNLGDLTQLMKSMDSYGQLNPIVVSPDLRLIAGNRRLESAKRLGWPRIDAIVLDDLDEVASLEIELDENVHRKPLTTDELADAFDRLEKLKNPGAAKRLLRGVASIFRRVFTRSRR